MRPKGSESFYYDSVVSKLRQQVSKLRYPYRGRAMSQGVTSVLLDERQLQHAISRIAHEVVESLQDDDQLAVIGIRSNGDHLAERLADEIRRIDGRKVEVGYMDITLYRDDLLTNPEHPEIRATDILFSLDQKLVLLVDDVLFTGRTIRAALNQIPDYGRPKAVRLAVLVDRGGRELPIRADYVGKNVPTAAGDDITVELKENGTEDRVLLLHFPEKESPKRKPRTAKRGKRK